MHIAGHGKAKKASVLSFSIYCKPRGDEIVFRFQGERKSLRKASASRTEDYLSQIEGASGVVFLGVETSWIK